MVRSIRAVLRLLATGIGVAREPRYVAVRIRAAPDEAARAHGDRAA